MVAFSMKKILAALFVFAFVFSSLSVVVGLSSHQANQNTNALSESAALLFGQSSSSSLNWAGYAVTGTNITSVTGSFVVPSLVTTTAGTGSHGKGGPNLLSGPTQYKSTNGHSGSGGSSQTSYAAFWAGIDGYNSNTVEQAGVMMLDQNGVASYSVWYEFYPAAPVYASWTPNPGDHIFVYVNYTASNQTFVATVIDTTLGQSYVSPYTAVSGAQRSSAEWIAEAPASGHSILPLADFGTAYFGSQYTGSGTGNFATVSGTSGTIGALSSSFSVYQINMTTRKGTLKASTSTLASDGNSFTVVWDHS